jgi:hypothetical protein
MGEHVCGARREVQARRLARYLSMSVITGAILSFSVRGTRPHMLSMV